MSGPTSALYVDPAIPRFTRAEIVAEMAERFGSMTEATFRHWQELGLVASPRSRRFEKGKAGSAPAMWSYNDKEQFGAVLDLRQRHFKEVGKPVDLCWLGNYVVWSWSFWDGFVELDQARRALRTWVTPQLGGAKGRARSKVTVNKLARQAVNQVAAPGISRSIRKAMAANIAEDLWHDDLERLRTRVPELTRSWTRRAQGVGSGPLARASTRPTRSNGSTWHIEVLRRSFGELLRSPMRTGTSRGRSCATHGWAIRLNCPACGPRQPTPSGSLLTWTHRSPDRRHRSC